MHWVIAWFCNSVEIVWCYNFDCITPNATFSPKSHEWCILCMFELCNFPNRTNFLRSRNQIPHFWTREKNYSSRASCFRTDGSSTHQNCIHRSQIIATVFVPWHLYETYQTITSVFRYVVKLRHQKQRIELWHRHKMYNQSFETKTTILEILYFQRCDCETTIVDMMDRILKSKL